MSFYDNAGTRKGLRRSENNHADPPENNSIAETMTDPMTSTNDTDLVPVNEQHVEENNATSHEIVDTDQHILESNQEADLSYASIDDNQLSFSRITTNDTAMTNLREDLSPSDDTYGTQDALKDDVYELTETVHEFVDKVSDLERSLDIRHASMRRQQQNAMQAMERRLTSRIERMMERMEESILHLASIQEEAPTPTHNNTDSTATVQQSREPVHESFSSSTPSVSAASTTISRMSSDPPEDERSSRTAPTVRDDDSLTTITITTKAPDPPEENPKRASRVPSTIKSKLADEQPSDMSSHSGTPSSKATVSKSQPYSGHRVDPLINAAPPVRPGVAQIPVHPPAAQAAPVVPIISKEIVLKLPAYYKTMKFDYWKSMCVLAARNNQMFPTITTMTPTGEHVFNPLMTNEESSQLFVATATALGKSGTGLINESDTRRANGIALWNNLEPYFNKAATSILLHSKVKKEFADMSKNPNETYLQYGLRIEDQLALYTRNNIPHPTHLEIVMKVLQGIKAQHVFDRHLLELSTSTWHIGMLPRQMAMWAENKIDEYQEIAPHIEIFAKKEKKNPYKKIQDDDEKVNKKKKGNQKRETEDPIDIANKLQKRLNNSQDALQDLYVLYGQNSNKCPIHSNGSHGLLECFTFKKVCTTCGISDKLKLVQKNVGLSTKDDSKDAKAAAKARRAKFQTENNQYYDDDPQQFYDEVNDDEDSEEEESNDTNTSANVYPPGLFNRTCRINNSNAIARTATDTTKLPSLPSQLNGIFRVVIDSGATVDMSPHKELFSSITYINVKEPESPTVMMGDESTEIQIHGYGPMVYNIHGKVIRRMGLYIPGLGDTSLISVKQHIKKQGCYFHAEDNQAQLAFPNFIVYPKVDKEIEVLVRPAPKTSSRKLHYDEFTAEPSTNPKTAESFVEDQTYNIIDSVKARYITEKDYSKFSVKAKVKKLIPQAHLPERATEGSIGFDIRCFEPFTIQPGEIKKVPTGLATAIPKSLYIRIAERSSLAAKHINIVGGVVDSDYRGEIKVMMKNNSSQPITFDKNSKIAQFIFERASIPYIEVSEVLEATSRKGGFGSTDKKKTPQYINTSKSYRVSETEILVLNTKSRRHPRVRRIRLPQVQQDPMEETIPTNPRPDTGRPELAKKPLHRLQQLEIDQQRIHQPFHQLDITHHRIDPREHTPVDPALAMNVDPIPSVQQLQHQSSTMPEVSTPPLLPVNKVNSSQSKSVTLSREMLSQSIGFRHPEPLLNHIKTLGNGKVKVQAIPKNPQLDPGETATMKSAKRNTTPLPKPKTFGEIMHMDIGFGPCAAIGGITHTLLVVDRATRHKFVYGLKNLTTSLHAAIQQLILDCDGKIKLLRTDFDKKLISGKSKSILREKGIKIEASPPYRQHQNGLVERHWQTVVNMSRNWLRSSLLPTKYWYFAMKRACEVCNILPVKKGKIITTPHELVYKQKVDYRVLFPMFSTAYIKYMRDDKADYQEDPTNIKWSSQSLKCIVVGTCSKSDGLLFYHPPTKQTFSCADGYKFDINAPAGAHFNERYDGNFIFNLKSDTGTSHIAPSHEKNDIVYVKTSDGDYIPATILTQPVDEEQEPYIVQDQQSGNILQLLASEILDHDPNVTPTNDPTLPPTPEFPWLQHLGKATLYLPDKMTQPKQGYLSNEGGTWTFIVGRSKSSDRKIDLTDDMENMRSMILNKKLFEGWKKHSVVLHARHVRATSNILAELIVARKVSAKGLVDMNAPTSLLKHKFMVENDKKIWDESYRQEYQGLVDIDTWETITEEQYQEMKHLYKGVMPTMAIAVIKYDGEGNPVRAKYRIVALGNLDPNNWEKSDCFAPVLSQLELRLLVSLAAKNKCIPKQGDITQAFCQSYLPPDENYICKPPIGCPHTGKGLYWKLKKTLYGLKRSPRHFYELARKTLIEVGLKQHPTSPCIFTGTLIEGHPPLYLGIYVDDMIFFSASPEVEKKFMNDFGAKLDTGFNDQIDYFLGIYFNNKRHKSGDVTIKLSQQAFTENLIESAGLLDEAVNTVNTPYRSGLPTDAIPNKQVSKEKQEELTHQMRVLCGSLNWLAQSTRPDIATITNILSRYTASPTEQHIVQAKRVIRYLKGTKSYGISYSSTNHQQLESFIKFPIPQDTILALSDANWGPQDQSKPRPNEDRTLDLFKSRSISGFLLWLGGPLHWVSKRQSITARSSAEAEIYATDECTKSLLHFHYLLQGMNLDKSLMPAPTTIYNDNSACVQWSRNTSTKGLRHIQIRENAVRESVQNNFIKVKHIEGKVNLSDMFTKEEKDPNHFIRIRNLVMTDKI